MNGIHIFFGFAILFVLLIVGGLLYRNFSVAMMLPLQDGRTRVISTSGISTKPAPDIYESNGFSQIESYMSKLLVESESFKSLMIHSPDGNRGLSFSMQSGVTHVNFVVHVLEEPAKEDLIREYFASLGIEPTEDYLAGNGLVRDASLILSYPVNGNAEELTAMAQELLQNICNIAANEALQINYH
jgi:hypothetical protein